MDVGKKVERNEKGYWIDFYPGVKVKIKPVSPQTQVRIHKQSTNRSFKRGQPQQEIDVEKFNTLLAQAAICEWEGIEKDGKAFPCTPENIKWMMDNLADFNLFVQEAALSIEAYISDQKEEAVKNS